MPRVEQVIQTLRCPQRIDKKPCTGVRKYLRPSVYPGGFVYHCTVCGNKVTLMMEEGK